MRMSFKYYIVYRYMDIKGISKNWYKHFLHGLHQRNRHPLKWQLWWFYNIHFRSFQQFSVKFGVKRETIRLICLKSTKFGFHGSFDRLADRGRWQSTRTARIYVNQAMQELSQIATSPAQLRTQHMYQRLVPFAECSLAQKKLTMFGKL